MCPIRKQDLKLTKALGENFKHTMKEKTCSSHCESWIVDTCSISRQHQLYLYLVQIISRNLSVNKYLYNTDTKPSTRKVECFSTKILDLRFSVITSETGYVLGSLWSTTSSASSMICLHHRGEAGKISIHFTKAPSPSGFNLRIS